METKAAASAIGFGVAVAASGGIAAGGASATGIIEAGGLVMNGVSAVIDMGTAVTIHATNGEGNEYTAAWEKTAEMLAPVNAVFAIGGGIQNIKDFRDPEKAKDMVNNAAQAFLTGIGFARDYIQDGTVLGVSSNIINGYREIIVRSSDTSDPEAAKEVLLKTGISEETMKSSDFSDEQYDGHIGAVADFYIEAMGELIDPDNPIDVNEFLKNVDNVIHPSEADSFKEDDNINVSAETPVVDLESEEISAPPDTSGNMLSDHSDALRAADVAGSYYFPELEDSAKIDFSVSDDSHLMMTDVDNGESFPGDYDETTGTLYIVVSDRFKWYVTVKFTADENGILAEIDESLNGSSIKSSSFKQ